MLFITALSIHYFTTVERTHDMKYDEMASAPIMLVSIIPVPNVSRTEIILML